MKKLLAVLLSIMMLAMPLTSMAENSVWDNAARQETTITIHDLNADLVAALGGDDTAMAAINDLLAALSLTGYQQGDEAGFDLNLSGKSVLGMASLTTAAEENQLMYVSSALLGGVIAVNSEDVEAIKEKALRATMKMSGQSDEEIDKAIEESKEQLSGNAEYTALMEAAANLSSMTEEQLMEELTQADTTAFMTMMNEILSGEEMAEVTEQPGDCDAAKSYVKVTVPPEKIVEMTKALLEMIHSVPSVGAYMDALFSAADTSWDDLLKELDEADLYADDIVYEYWMTEAGELVRMTASVKINNGGEEALPISFTMTRNTADGVATWLVTIKSAEDTAATLTFAGDLENFTANLTAYAGEDLVEINVSGKGVGTDSSVVDVEIKETVDGVEQGFGVVVTTATTMDGEHGVRKVDVLVRRVFDLVRTIPGIAWTSVMVTLVGIGFLSKALVIFISAMVAMVINSYSGIKQTKTVHLWVGQTFGASNWELLTKVAIPSALPMIFTGLDVALGSAWTTLVAAELLASTKGLGFMIQQARGIFRLDIIIVGMIVIAITGAVLSSIIQFIGRKLIKGGRRG